jgi:hypothetical protein
MSIIGRFLAAFAIALPVLAIHLSESGAVDQGRGSVVLDADIAGPARDKKGEWRTKVQQIFDPGTRTLSRRTYTVWDADPQRNLDFAWTPDRPAADRPGRISGSGRLVWRVRDKPTYDPSAIIAEYRGTFRNGRIDGHGSYIDRAGMTYDGNWRAGVANGYGWLKLPGGDEYVGSFRDGKAYGGGRYIDVTGEIYEGPFVAGQRHGSGVTTLPNGRTYHSLWMAGSESDRSRLVRIAQGPGVRVTGSADDIRIGITVDTRVPDRDLHQNDLWYSARNDATAVQIRPASDRLIKMWQEQGPLQLGPGEDGILSLAKEKLIPLKLQIDVQNRTPTMAQITGLYLDVKESSTDRKPAIQIDLAPGDPNQTSGSYDYRSKLIVANYGWGPAAAARIRFSLPVTQTGAGGATFEVTKSLGDIQHSVLVDLEPDLKAAGVDTGYLKALEEGFVCKSKVPSQCLQEVRRTGKFGTLGKYIELNETTIVLKLASMLEYSWQDSKGSKRDWKHPFVARLNLGILKQEAEQGEGATPQIVTTKTQQFKLDSAGYRIPVAFQAAIQPGRTNPLILAVQAEKSSKHEFTVVVQMADGREIRSRPVELTYYRPSWFAEDEAPQVAPESANPDEPIQSVSNYDFVGTDLRRFKTAADYDTPCSEACTAAQACRAYTFDRWNNTCALKSGVSAMRLEPGRSSGFKKGMNRPPELPDAKVLEPYKNAAIKNSSARATAEQAYLIDLKSTSSECQQRCRDDEKCLAFTFKKRNSDCFLFDDPTGFASDSDADSGIKRQPAK